MNDQPPAEHIANAELRDWNRFPPDTPETCVIVADKRKCATILDESFGGIGVTIEMADAVNVKVGDPLIILHYNPMPGRVQWIQKDRKTQRVRLGIRWSS